MDESADDEPAMGGDPGEDGHSPHSDMGDDMDMSGEMGDDGMGEDMGGQDDL